MSMGRCKSCGAQIEWVLTVKGHNMPLDVTPIAGGNIKILDNGRAQVVDTHPDVIRSVSHFTTCPEANAHRRRKT